MPNAPGIVLDDAAPESSGRPLRVTVVTPFGTDAGGAEQWLLALIQHSHGVSYRVLVLQAGPLATRLRELGVDVAVVPTGASAAALAKAKSVVLRDLRSHRPDVAMGNGVKGQVALAGPSLLLGIPTVWVKHDHSFDSTLVGPLGRMSTRVVATAEEVGRAVRRDDVVVIEPERPPAPLDQPAARAALAELLPTAPPADAARLTLAMVGRLVPYKGLDIAISALAYPAAADWRLVAIGADDPATPGEQQRLTGLAHDLGVSDRVTFLGPVPHAGQYLAAFDALAVLTRPGQANAPQREGYGITATEAMLAGRPVIVAGEGPIARRIDTPAGPAGIVVRPADPLATATALKTLTDPQLRMAMGARGHAVAAVAPDASAVAAAMVHELTALKAGRTSDSGKVIP
jgi:glycosyltransferase involved in cell wall biosynthesis